MTSFLSCDCGYDHCAECGAAMRLNKIQIERRRNDWIAFIKGQADLWEAGRTEAEAAGKLILRLQKDIDD